MRTAAYIHIPFCEHICHYCDFNKVFLKNQPVDEYIQALLHEMHMTINEAKPDQLKTIYVGGGTPTALSAAQLRTLFAGMHSILPMEQIEEFTVEVNPDSSEEEKLAVMKEFGVNRLSIGVQSFDQSLLDAIGRTHSSDSVHDAVKRSREAGFDNLSLDLMFGLPHQSVEQFIDTIEKAAELGVEHLSAYSLKIEEKTVFFNRQRKGKLSLPPEEDEVTMYEELRKRTKAHGFVQYEISNFSKPGRESKHNLVYWNNDEYYGFGAGAHGYVNGVRHQNIGPVPKYIEAVNQKKLPYLNEHKVSRVEQIEEAMFMGLRKLNGVDLEELSKRYDKDLKKLYNDQIKDLSERGLLVGEQGMLKLTNEGLLLANEVFEQFLAVLEN
ncbi:radical SAM family heme chaperone HemW [Alkalihalophilus marmarensis]|jgi:oxygen-independent coproporphyrinogen-3 oxidase|uniref:Heme chaperone HemW n=1 Tax=Alkalihalophilus marmarensis DSM 21297 TaxID=1188261 RepID=U6SSK3_9BACI|nr:radical SAM family heme chaperone HemW [Alkalihalophilus marmarensis]ERN54699.1 coproporphyrinogen III oxidase [Alkalihalophilus marmarensis DSM 21297]MCM3488679.1 radical SAM family heme chaperone HemW [Alkalihalophilus marmarensis]